MAVIAMMFITVGWLRRHEWYRRRVVWPLSFVIAAVGLYWTVTRITGSSWEASRNGERPTPVS